MKRTILGYLAGALMLLLSAGAHAGITDLAQSPLVTSASSSVRPNLMFVLDDSGSMDWDYLPDWANTSNQTLFRNNTYNGVAYNPAVTYSPPVYFNSDGTVNTTAYPSMTSGNTSTWSSVKNDGYGIQSTGTSNLVGDANFYTFVAGEYCDKPNLKTCVTQSAPSIAYPYPATLRWCTSSAMTSCQAVRIETGTTYMSARYPIASATITVSGSSTTSVTGITVNGVQIMSSGTSGSSSSSTLASSIASNVGLAGFDATRSGSTVTITGPTTTIGYTPVITKSGSMTITATALSSAVPGSNLFTNIVSGNNSYPYPGKTAKATTRTDCAGTTCTYAEEMTNYANWWAYYHTRMQMMKTSSSLAFQSVGSNYRVGYATINGNQSQAFLNLNTFDNTQKLAWYNKFFAAVPNNSTPLRAALSKIGRVYAGKLNGGTIDGVTVVDPMQYSCQQNFTILSTDGYWNESSGYYQVDGSTSIGNQDSAEPRPFNDGGGSTVTARTPTSTVVRSQTVTGNTVTTVWQRFAYTDGGDGNDGCSSSRSKLHQQEQRQTETKTTTVTSVDDATTTATRTVVTVNGVVTSDTTSTSNSNSNVSNNTAVGSDSFTAWTNHGSDTTTGSCRNSITLPSPNPSNPSIVTTSTSTTSGPTTTVVSTTGPTAGATTTTTSSTGGISNTLADVSEYYYANDLRTSTLGNCTGAPIPPAVTGLDVCTNDVPQSGLDGASWQHMTTFTLGLGASGYMQFTPNYATSTSGDFFDVKNGTTANPAGGICSWQSSGACNWPAPVSNEQTTIDDLWHAAVNGRASYFSATNPASLNSGLASALAGVSARTGSSAAATTSNPNVTSGDNFVFSSTFTTNTWDGELVRQQLDLVTGVVSSSVDWAAQAQLDTNSSRTLYTFDGAAAGKLKDFNWASLTATEQAYFTLPAISSLSQFCVSGITCLAAADQTAASGQPLVDFLRGDRTNEGVSTDTSKYFRQRSHVLGDVVNAEAVYVKMPLFNYADAGYGAYITAKTTRQGMVYAAGNDGMLHAFNASTGAEAFAYVPSMVISNMYKLADKNYSANHRYLVDGTPVSGDVYFGGVWHTIVVGGLNGGGRGYYALDVTNPATPTALWEFTDTNMGYTYGNPTITKLADGTWVVLVTSGYNNVSPGDGIGRLYVLNAGTGALIRSISTGVGSTTTPSGLARISAWVTNATADNTALRVYGGDQLGNLWRFDINGNVGAAGYDAQLLTTLYANSAGTITQPITTRPELGDVAGVAVVYVGTGRFLGVGDLTDTTLQTFYAVKDTLGTTTYTNPQASGSGFVQQVVSNTTCPAGSPATICTLGQLVRTSTSNTVNFATNNGWYVNLPDSGERANTDPNLALGTLGFTTNIPNTSACTAGGYSYRYVLDYRTGAPVSTSTTGVSAIKLGNALSTRGVFVRLPNNTVVQLTRLSDGTTMTTNVPIGAGVAPVRRVSWRELIQDQ
jgi:type IV pilus assembly protein PilY1